MTHRDAAPGLTSWEVWHIRSEVLASQAVRAMQAGVFETGAALYRLAADAGECALDALPADNTTVTAGVTAMRVVSLWYLGRNHARAAAAADRWCERFADSPGIVAELRLWGSLARRGHGGTPRPEPTGTTTSTTEEPCDPAHRSATN